MSSGLPQRFSDPDLLFPQFRDDLVWVLALRLSGGAPGLRGVWGGTLADDGAVRDADLPPGVADVAREVFLGTEVGDAQHLTERPSPEGPLLRRSGVRAGGACLGISLASRSMLTLAQENSDSV